MNQNKFCFIMCATEESYVNESLFYINQLKIPVGYEMDALTVQDVSSIASGYNAGMRESDAKYKIYLRQNTLIVNPHFLSDILRVFADASIGMLGVVGSPRLPEHGVMRYGAQVGRIYRGNPLDTSVQVLGKGELYDVEAIDGTLMATQYDVPWREDLFGGDSYYDLAQSFEFCRRGYRVVVPDMAQPWCLLDQGFLDGSVEPEARKNFLAAYAKEMSRGGV